MNTKNVIIATIVGATLLGSVACSTKVGNNEVAKVPTVSADVPRAVELPFLYSHNSLMTNYVQKEGIAFTKATTIPTATPIAYQVNDRQEDAKEGKEDSFKKYDVPLSADLQKYAQQLCDKLGISYELILATIKVESDFKSNLISPTNDYGLMQINRSNFSWLRKDLKENFNIDWDWKDPYHNMTAGIYYYYNIRLDLLKRGYSEDSLTPVAILSYNMGGANAKNYLKTHNAKDWAYVRKVLQYKTKIEKGEAIYDTNVTRVAS
jgi:soluble lytic murein transglycosylase-like protein